MTTMSGRRRHFRPFAMLTTLPRDVLQWVTNVCERDLTIIPTVGVLMYLHDIRRRIGHGHDGLYVPLDGTIDHLWTKVNPDGHAAGVLAWLDAYPRG